jgi:DNA-binding transcriptional LysR family regulator
MFVDGGKRVDENEEDPRWESVDFRHLGAFQKVYEERNYTNAGHRISTTRKSMVRMIQNLEKTFECEIFSEAISGELQPSAFAERLFNDLRFLDVARHRMKDYVSRIHDEGRVLNVGCSAAVFRTREFRNLFRKLQSLPDIRACYSPIDSASATKALVSGHCDFYIGCWSGAGPRFVTQNLGNVPFRIYQRSGRDENSVAGNPCLVCLDGNVPVDGAMREKPIGWELIHDSRWLYWLDYPEKCPAGTVICGPDVQLDMDRWLINDGPENACSLPLYASFLRQHPYEFLPMLTTKIQYLTST